MIDNTLSWTASCIACGGMIEWVCQAPADIVLLDGWHDA